MYFIRLCRQLYTALLLITIIFIFINPKIAGLFLSEDFGIRILGSKICDFRYTALVVFLISFYLYFNENFKKTDLFYLLFSIVCLYFSKTRSAIIPAIFLALFIFIIFASKKNVMHKDKFKPVYFSIVAIFLIFLFFQNEIVNITTRYQTVKFISLSGRDIIWSWAFDYMQHNFWGAGFSNGFKSLFTNLPIIVDPTTGYVLYTKNIGNAHNIFIEVLVSSGWLAFFSYIILILFSFFKAYKNINLNSEVFIDSEVLIFILFTAMIFFGMFDAYLLVPTSTNFGFFWTIIILIYTNKKRIKKDESINSNK